MKREEYLKKLVANPNFDAENVIWVPLDDIDTSAHEINNEARATGLVPTYLQQLEYEIETEGQLVPISASPMPSEKYEGCDGGHRMHCLRRLREKYKKYKSKEKFTHAKCVERTYSNSAERAIGMLNDNRGYVSNIATHDDIVGVYHKNISDRKVLGTDLRQLTYENVKDYMNDKLKPKLHHKTLAVLAKRVYNKLGSPSSKYTMPVDDEALIKEFNRINKFGITLDPKTCIKEDGTFKPSSIVTKKGDKIFVYVCKQKIWAEQNQVHYILKRKDKDPSTKVMVIAYNNKIVGASKDACPVKSYRTTIGGALAYWNSHPNINIQLVDKLVFMPQIILGKNKESMEYLYNAEGNKIYYRHQLSI